MLTSGSGLSTPPLWTSTQAVPSKTIVSMMSAEGWMALFADSEAETGIVAARLAGWVLVDDVDDEGLLNGHIEGVAAHSGSMVDFVEDDPNFIGYAEPGESWAGSDYWRETSQAQLAWLAQRNKEIRNGSSIG